MGGTAWRAPISCVSLKDGGGGAIWAIDCHLRRLTPWALCRARYARIFSRLYLRTRRGGGQLQPPRQSRGRPPAAEQDALELLLPLRLLRLAPRPVQCDFRLILPLGLGRGLGRRFGLGLLLARPVRRLRVLLLRGRGRGDDQALAALALALRPYALGRRGGGVSARVPRAGRVAGRTFFSFSSSRFKRCCSLLRWS